MYGDKKRKAKVMRGIPLPDIDKWLISCQYDFYSKGWSNITGHFLVSANSFEEACSKITEFMSDHSGMKNPTGFSHLPHFYDQILI
jgi:hypothetical protein